MSKTRRGTCTVIVDLNTDSKQNVIRTHVDVFIAAAAVAVFSAGSSWLLADTATTADAACIVSNSAIQSNTTFNRRNDVVKECRRTLEHDVLLPNVSAVDGKLGHHNEILGLMICLGVMICIRKV